MGQGQSVYRVNCYHLNDPEDVGFYNSKDKAINATIKHILSSNPHLITESLIDSCILTDEEFEYLPHVKENYTSDELSLFDTATHNHEEEEKLAERIWNILKEDDRKLFMDHYINPEYLPILYYTIKEMDIN